MIIRFRLTFHFFSRKNLVTLDICLLRPGLRLAAELQEFS